MRHKTLFALCAAAALNLSPVYGKTLQERLVEQLKTQGFTTITVSRTWLGRTRITAFSTSQEREIVFSTKSGEILRDYWSNQESNGSGVGLIDSSDGLSGSFAASGLGTTEDEAGASGGSGGGSGGGGPFNYLTGGASGDIAFPTPKVGQ